MPLARYGEGSEMTTREAESRVPVPGEVIAEFCRRWKVSEFGLFGSVLREDFDPDSDIDVLISFAPDARWSLFEWLEMIDELKRFFGREVHLVSRAALRNPFRRHEILRTVRIIHAA
jgi:hypothetical protein